MKEVRNWLVNKCKIQPGFGQQTKEQQSYGSVVTPQNIPEFIIPRSNSDGSSQRDSGEKLSIDEDDNSRNSISPPDSRQASPRLSPRTSCTGLAPDVPKCSRSAPTSPYKPAAPLFKNVDLYSCEDLQVLKTKDTNADPQSMAAMSLPHFRTKTAFGFTTLNQAPHTRRKESLFHCDTESIPSLLNRRQSKKKNNAIDIARSQDIIVSLSPNPPPLGQPDEEFPLSRRGSRRRETPTTVVTPVTILTGKRCSPETSPLPSPVSPACPSPIRSSVGPMLSPYHLSPDMANTSRKSRRNRLYYRRRSSLPGFEEDEQSSTECSSSETSPIGRRKSNGTLLVPGDVNLQKRHSSPCPSSEQEILQCSVMALKLSCSCSDTSATRFQSHMLAEFGEVKLSFQYLTDTKQFKVGLIKAENLGGRNKADQNINSYAKIYLMPGKVQRHTSDTVKRTRDPVYNQEFYFNDILIDELRSMKLKIKIFHKGHNFSRHVFIGEIVVPLAKYNIQHEQRMWKDLEPKMDSEVSHVTYNQKGDNVFLFYSIFVLSQYRGRSGSIG